MEDVFQGESRENRVLEADTGGGERLPKLSSSLMRPGRQGPGLLLYGGMAARGAQDHTKGSAGVPEVKAHGPSQSWEM